MPNVWRPVVDIGPHNFVGRTCPHCKIGLTAVRGADWDCGGCGRRIMVRDHHGARWLLTERQARAFDGQPDAEP
jgi:hypothetical protein